VKLLFDQNLSRHLVRQLAVEFPESRHVTDVDLDTATDAEIWSWAGEHGFVIVSKDSDFRQLGIGLSRIGSSASATQPTMRAEVVVASTITSRATSRVTSRPQLSANATARRGEPRERRRCTPRGGCRRARGRRRQEDRGAQAP